MIERLESPSEIVMAVIRGERALTSLEKASVSFEIVRRRSGERRINVTASSSFTVKPDPVDIAAGLRSHRDDPEVLGDWATFILAADIVDLATMEASPERDDLLNALWDASFEWSHRGSKGRQRQQ
jgi:hypothetical protein